MSTIRASTVDPGEVSVYGSESLRESDYVGLIESIKKDPFDKAEMVAGNTTQRLETRIGQPDNGSPGVVTIPHTFDESPSIHPAQQMRQPAAIPTHQGSELGRPGGIVRLFDEGDKNLVFACADGGNAR